MTGWSPVVSSRTSALVLSLADAAERDGSLRRAVRAAERKRGMPRGSVRSLLRGASSASRSEAGSMLHAEALRDLLFGAHVAISELAKSLRAERRRSSLESSSSLARHASYRVGAELRSALSARDPR